MHSPSELRWCVGKFVYPKGGQTLLHFMPLHDFHLEEALNVAAIVALRTQRLSGGKGGVGSGELSRWIDTTATWQLAAVAADLLDGGPELPTVVEYDPGHGLLFEALKLFRAQRGHTRGIRYVGVGSRHVDAKFRILHGQERPEPEYLIEGTAPQAHLTIVNHACGIRSPEGSVVSLESILPSLIGAGLLALRVVESEHPHRRTTVRGQQVELAPLDDCLARLRVHGGWSYKYQPDHDADFFLPEAGPRTGLLMAYRRATPGPQIQRFRPIDGN